MFNHVCKGTVRPMHLRGQLSCESFDLGTDFICLNSWYYMVQNAARHFENTIKTQMIADTQVSYFDDPEALQANELTRYYLDQYKKVASTPNQIPVNQIFRKKPEQIERVELPVA